MRTFEGLMPALVTPFTTDGATNQEHMRKLTAYHLQKGVSGFYVCGGTGQGVHMSVNDRKKAAEAVIEETAGAVPVLVHVGSMVALDAVELARHAATHGASAISSILPPGYATMESLVAYFTRLSRAAPDTPLLPYLVNASINVPALVERLCSIPTIAGTKYTGPNMDEMKKVIEIGRSLSASGVWSVMAGMDQQCLFAAMAGANGNIGSSLSVIPGPYRVIWELFRQGDYDRAFEMQLKATAVIDTMKKYNYTAGLRYGLNLLGVECSPPCLPELPLDEKSRKALEIDLEKIGFAELAAL